jgi:hypothetical protein
MQRSGLRFAVLAALAFALSFACIAVPTAFAEGGGSGSDPSVTDLRFVEVQGGKGSSVLKEVPESSCLYLDGTAGSRSLYADIDADAGVTLAFSVNGDAVDFDNVNVKLSDRLSSDVKGAFSHQGSIVLTRNPTGNDPQLFTVSLHPKGTTAVRLPLDDIVISIGDTPIASVGRSDTAGSAIKGTGSIVFDAPLAALIKYPEVGDPYVIKDVSSGIDDVMKEGDRLRSAARMLANANLPAQLKDDLMLTLSIDGQPISSVSAGWNSLGRLRDARLDLPQSTTGGINAQWRAASSLLSDHDIDDGTYLISVSLDFDTSSGHDPYYGMPSDKSIVTVTRQVLVDKNPPHMVEDTTGSNCRIDAQRANDEGMAATCYVSKVDGASITVTLSDDEAGVSGSGIDEGSVRLMRTDGRPLRQDIAVSGDTYTFTLKDEGVYQLDELYVNVQDIAGNVLGSDHAHLVAIEDGTPMTTLVIDRTADPISLGWNLPSAEDASGNSMTAEGKDTSLTFTVNVDDPYYNLFYEDKDIWSSASRIVLDPADSGYAGTREWAIRAPQGPRRGIKTSSIKINESGSVPEGLYSINARFNPIDRFHKEKSLLVDYSAPTMSDASLTGQGKTMTALYDDSQGTNDGHAEFAANHGVIEVHISDGANGVCAGVDSDTVSLEIPYASELGADTPDQGQTHRVKGTESASEPGTYVFELEDEGTYFIDQATVTAADTLNNSEPVSLEKILAKATGQGQTELPYTKLYVTRTQPGQPIVNAVDLETTEPAAAPQYHRGAFKVTVSNLDPLLDFYEHVTDSAGSNLEGSFLSYSYRTDANGTPDAHTSAASDLTKDAGGSFVIPFGDSGDKPDEGFYDFTVTFRWLGTPEDSGEIKTSPLEAICDHTPPTVGALMVSDGGSQDGWRTYDGSLVLPHDATLTMDVVDPISGVDDDTLQLDDYPTDQESATVEQGMIVYRLVGDNQRLDLGASTVRIRDNAGNWTRGISLSTLAGQPGSNVPDDTHTLIVDTVAPTLSVSYDNNDVRNGRYYAAGRTATVSLEENTFDLIKANEPNRVIATIGADGSTSDLRVRDFETIDGGTTWVATYECASDGDWTLDSDFADLVGHAANHLHDEFTVDTISPMIAVTFDNEDARNGMYYNAPRNAIVTVTERNFSGDLASATSWARDASGAEAGAPAASAWNAGGDQYEWTCGISYAGELHYGMSVQCTDLAGNTAETYEVPEFVIDMTPPVAEISGVENRTAYAGTVSPVARTSDTNYDFSASSVELTGAHRGEVSWQDGMDMDMSETGETLSISDFDRELEDDDVYTISATSVDLAGNTASDSRTFSVNRFGSNYLFSDATGSLNGTYLQSPQDVTVTEINVSGLDDSRTRIELARGTSVDDLQEGEDYWRQVSDDQGWSETTYTIPAAEFSQDGYYRVSLTSTDLAGNLAQNTMQDKNATRDADASIAFAVDATKPTGTIANVRPYGVYFGGDRDVTLISSDNLELDSETLVVDGDEVATWDAADMADGRTTWTLAADAHPHDITLVARDRAGNTSITNVAGVVAATDFIEYLKATPTLLFAVVAAAICIVGGIVIAIWALVRRHRRLETRRNPFAH